MSTSTDPRAAAVIAFYERLRPADLAGLGRIYTEQAFFKDPFNEVHDLGALRRVFTHMFETLDAPRFQVLHALVQGQQCSLSWDFLFRFKGRAAEQRIHGASHLRFAPDGRVAYHRDYWDAAELYEKLPLLGAPLRWLRRRVRA